MPRTLFSSRSSSFTPPTLATSALELRLCGETLLEGAHLLEVALERGWQPRLIVVSKSGRAQPEIAVRLARGDAQSLIKLSDRTSAPSILVADEAGDWS